MVVANENVGNEWEPVEKDNDLYVSEKRDDLVKYVIIKIMTVMEKVMSDWVVTDDEVDEGRDDEIIIVEIEMCLRTAEKSVMIETMKMEMDVLRTVEKNEKKNVETD